MWPHLLTSPQSCLRVLTTQQLASPRLSGPKEQDRSHISFITSTPKTQSFLQYPIGYTSQPFPMWEETTKGREYKGARIIEDCLESWFHTQVLQIHGIPIWPTRCKHKSISFLPQPLILFMPLFSSLSTPSSRHPDSVTGSLLVQLLYVSWPYYSRDFHH